MKATIRDKEVLEGVAPLQIAEYMRSKGWQPHQIPGGAIWRKSEFEVLIPADSHVRDFPMRIAEALAVLEKAEETSQIQILEDLTIVNADVIRPRLPGASNDGTISLEQGMVLHARARDLMLAAACAAIEPRGLYARRKPEQAMDYLDRARFGIPRRGSYIMTIISPVPPALASAVDLLGTPADVQEPFERKAVRMLASGLEAIFGACPEVAATGKLDAMMAATGKGVSANLCEAIVGISEATGKQGVEFSFAWSSSRPVANDAISAISIGPDAIPIIAETARVLRDTEPVDNIEVSGTVQRLEHLRGQQGDVTVLGMADGKLRTVHVQLAGEEHLAAVRAYETREPVTCSGQLIREGWAWRLANPFGFRILESLF